MAQVRFSERFDPWVSAPPLEVSGRTVGEVLRMIFQKNQPLQSFLMDERGRLRKAILVFVDGRRIEDRIDFTDQVLDYSKIYIQPAPWIRSDSST